jgi:RHS repeat-associated protein
MGNITALGNAPGATPATETYSYDPLYRLTQITEADGSTLESVTYNPTGDRLSKAGSGLATGTYSYNPNTHQLIATGNAARSVDANGNTTAVSQAGGVYGFGYNDRNRMAVAQLAGNTVGSYTYNALNQRVGKVVNSTAQRFSYDEDSQMLAEYGATNRDYIWMDGIPVANVDVANGSSTISYVTADQLGTPRVVADGNSNTIWQWPYQGNAWGEQQPANGSYSYNPRFAGQYSDVETGLSNNVNRDYDAATGRYIQSDPSGLAGGISTYATVNNNPLSYTDPLGLQSTAQCLNPVNAPACAAAGMLPEAGAGAVSNGAAAGGAVGDAFGGTVLGGAIALPKDAANTCPDDDCDKRNKAVKDAKDKVGALGKCVAGMSRYQLQIRADAWLDLAISRARRDQKCWQGGDDGHQQAQSDAWQNAARCQELLSR